MFLSNLLENRLQFLEFDLSFARHFDNNSLSAKNFCYSFHITHNNYLSEIIFKANKMVK